MDFPAFVPAGAREYIRRTLEGDADGGFWEGLSAMLAEGRAPARVKVVPASFMQRVAYKVSPTWGVDDAVAFAVEGHGEHG